MPCLLHRLRNALLVKGLQQIVNCVHFERLDSILVVGGGKNDLRQRYFLVEQLLDRAEAVEARHLHVEKDEVGREFFDQVDRFDAVLALRHDVHIEIAQEIGQLVASELFVIHNDGRKGHALSWESINVRNSFEFQVSEFPVRYYEDVMTTL